MYGILHMRQLGSSTFKTTSSVSKLFYCSTFLTQLEPYLVLLIQLDDNLQYYNPSQKKIKIIIIIIIISNIIIIPVYNELYPHDTCITFCFLASDPRSP
jgi:hypothetical protein